MRVSAIQKDLLFVLFAIEARGAAGPVPGVRLLKMINASRSAEVFPANFRASCHTLVDHGLLQKYRSESLKLAFSLTDEGRKRAEAIYSARVGAAVTSA